MSARVRLFAILLLALRCGAAEPPWIRVKTAHFELYTNDTEKKGREAILYFEQVRNFFLQASPSKQAPDDLVRIVAFRTEKQYAPYRPSEFAGAYYARSQSRDCIVMHSIAPERYPMAIHEYMHLIIEHTRLHLPPWANEGLADFFSTLKPMGRKALVGGAIPGRLQTLQRNKWLDLDALDAVDYSSPYYNEREKANIFYAESWALVHMLRLSQEYSAGYEKLLMALHSGQHLGESLQAVYGKDSHRTYQDLERYLNGNRFPGELYDLKLERSEEDAAVTPVSDYDRDLVLADLYSRVKKKAEARVMYERLLGTDPGRPEAEEEFGYLLWESGDKAGAAEHLRRAVELGTKNPRACFHAGSLNRGPAARKAFERAIALKPDYTDAIISLGLVYMNEQNYREALAQFGKVKNVPEERAATVYAAVAHASLATGKEPEARSNAELAKKWAKTPAEIAQADSVIQYLDELKARQERQKTQAQKLEAERLAAQRKTPARKTRTTAKRARKAAPVKAQPKPAVEEEEDLPVPQFYGETGPEGPPVRRAEGMATKLDCAEGRVKLYVRVDAKLIAFLIANPSGINIRHSGSASFDFTCGPQKPFRVAVEYVPRSDIKARTVGDVRALEF